MVENHGFTQPFTFFFFKLITLLMALHVVFVISQTLQYVLSLSLTEAIKYSAKINFTCVMAIMLIFVIVAGFLTVFVLFVDRQNFLMAHFVYF